MDNSKEFSLMLDNAIKQQPNDFKNFDRTKNVQDQLQEMVICPSGCLTTWIQSFLKFAQKKLKWKSSIKDISMEQLWMAFVMKEKYSKQWLTNEQEWIKI